MMQLSPVPRGVEPAPGTRWTSGPYKRCTGTGSTVLQQGAVEVVELVNRRRDCYAVVRDLATGDRFRVGLDRFGGSRPADYQRLSGPRALRVAPFPPTRRGTSNTNARGSVYDRKRRRDWMISKFGVPRADGKKTRIPCHHCSALMRAEPAKVTIRLAFREHDTHPRYRTFERYSWEVDRFPKAGRDGGTYARSNIVPSCPGCNKSRVTASQANAERQARPRGTST